MSIAGRPAAIGLPATTPPPNAPPPMPPMPMPMPDISLPMRPGIPHLAPARPSAASPRPESRSAALASSRSRPRTPNRPTRPRSLRAAQKPSHRVPRATAPARACAVAAGLPPIELLRFVGVHGHEAGVLAHQAVISRDCRDLFFHGRRARVVRLLHQVFDFFACPDLRQHVVPRLPPPGISPRTAIRRTRLQRRHGE